VNNDGTVDFVSTPSAKAFSIFNNMTGNEQVEQTITGNDVYYTFERNGSYNVPVVKVISSKDEEGNIYVTAVNNRKDDKTPVIINADNRNLKGKEIDVWYLTADSVEDENTLEAPNNVDVVKTKEVSGQEAFSYELAPHSITAFKIPAEEKEALSKVSVTVNAEAGGTASGSAEVEKGSKVTVTATPGAGYLFGGWYAGGVKVSDQAVYTFTANQSISLTAKFTKENVQKDEVKLPDAGVEVTDSASNGKYTVTSSGASEATVEFTGVADKKLTQYKIPDSIQINGVDCKITSIKANAFKGNKKLKKVTIGSNVTTIGDKAFYQASSLKEVVISSNVKKIGKQVFANNKKLKKITIKTKKLTKKSVGKNAFKGIHAKAIITVPAKKLTSYKKLLKERGVGKKVVIKK